MLDFLLNSLLISANAVLQFTLIPIADVPATALHEVVPAEYKALSYIWNDIYPCRFHGVVIPVERDWEETVNNGYVTTTLPAEPGKTFTRALLVNKKSCPGKDDEALFVISSLGGAFLGRGVPKGIHILFLSPDRDASKQPKWLPQALQALELAANQGNKAAQEFVAFSGTQPKTKNSEAKAD